MERGADEVVEAKVALRSATGRCPRLSLRLRNIYIYICVIRKYDKWGPTFFGSIDKVVHFRTAC